MHSLSLSRAHYQGKSTTTVYLEIHVQLSLRVFDVDRAFELLKFITRQPIDYSPCLHHFSPLSFEKFAPSHAVSGNTHSLVGNGFLLTTGISATTSY